VKFGHTAYTVDDEPVVYTWRDHLFGPVVTSDDLFTLEFRAFNEGWHEWLNLVMDMKSTRKRRWMLAYLRDNIITVRVKEIREDVYEDEDPYEGMG
jgi:hypothetical protein